VRHRRSRTTRAAAAGIAGALAGAALLAPSGAATAAEGPAAGEGLRQVLFVANNWDGTADLVDQDTLTVVRRMDVIPDIEERMAEIRTDPVRLGYYLGIRALIGEGNDQYADDMFTSADGRFLYISRPSLADVVGIDMATGEVVWRFPMEGQRSDHMAISPDGTRLVVSDSTANVAHVLDPRTGEKVADFASGDSPHENTFSRDGARLFHASIGLVYTPLDRPALDTTKGERYLQIVDTSDWTFDRRDLADNLVDDRASAEVVTVPGAEDRWPDNSAIRPMALPPEEDRLYLQLSFFHGYVTYDLAEDRITQAVNLPDLLPPTTSREQYLLDSAHHGLALSPDGEKLCVAGTMSDYGAIVPVDDPGSLTLVQPIVKPYWSTNSGDGRYCFLSASGADEVVVVDYATAREVTRIPVGDHPQRMRLGLVREDLLQQAPAPAPAPTGAAPAPAAAAGTVPARRALPATGWAWGAPALLALGLAGLAWRRRAAPRSE
jgi:hypothetical protein